jgi:RNA polymerase sigma-70 factor (ECF subfamily)
VDSAARDELERVIAAHHAAGDFGAAATAAVKGYGPELLGYLFGATHREQDSAEIFSEFCEDLWRGIAGFRGESSFRTWSYRVAYHALARARRSGVRTRRRIVLIDVPELAAIADHVRTRTLPHLRTEIKNEVMRLREQLPEDDRALLILRIDRRLSWDEIAAIMEPEAPTAASVKRTSATLRKRFERVKARLRELAKDLVLPE